MSLKELMDRLKNFPDDSLVLCGIDEIDNACDVAQVLAVSDGDRDVVLIMQQEVMRL